MKLPTFNHAEMEWDDWRAFHVEHGYHKFVQFDTGELVVCSRNWDPDARMVYGDLHLQIAATADKDCPRLYIPGAREPVPRSHLTYGGQQVLLLDLDHRRAVSLEGWLTGENKPSWAAIPERFTGKSSPGRNITAYYAGPGAVPIGSPIVRQYPFPLTTAQREHLQEIKNACNVWLQMQPDCKDLMKRLDYKSHVWAIGFVAKEFKELTHGQRTTIARDGFTMMGKEEHAWLTFNVTQKGEDK